MMKQIKGNIIELGKKKLFNAICITTNGVIKKDGRGVMGAGIALEAKKAFPGIDKNLGNHLHTYGNHVGLIYKNGVDVFSFPTKYHFKEPAELYLIERSCSELVSKFKSFKFPYSIALPRPGCGFGKLDWSEVKPILEKYLDDRFFVVDLVGEERERPYV